MTTVGDATATASAVAPGPAAPVLQPALAAELDAGDWDFPWRLAPGLSAPVGDPAARHAAWTLGEMVESRVRDALALGGGGRSALHVACGEGLLAHQLLRWHASHVTGMELAGRRLRRAELLRRHFAVPERALELRAMNDHAALDAAALGQFDVVVISGVPERTPDAGHLIRLAAARARSLCVIESDCRLLEQLAEEAGAAGFGEVTRVASPTDGERRYVLGERAVLAASRRPAA